MTTLPPQRILLALDTTLSDHPGEAWVTEMAQWTPEPAIKRTGSPHADVIVAEADEHHADLIVLEQHDEGLIRRLVGASSADMVRHRAPCSVLLARAAPAGGRVLVAYDATPSSEDALRFAARFCAASGRAFDILHVRTPGEEWTPTLDTLPALEKRPERVDSTAIVDSGEVGRIVEDAARERRAPLIVVGSHAHPRLWSIIGQSVSNYLAHHGRASVLVVKS